ncbi:MAG TPA: sensor domain-containing diguanylate cyclase [Vicinamibacterales bacterium]|nr:sensor domain-containing diguanylate cyclase [Vicinamibacterales bacterium]
MADRRLVDSDLKRIGDLVAAAPKTHAALDQLATEVARALDTGTCVFYRADRGWMLAAQSRGGLRLPVAELPGVADMFPRTGSIVTVNLDAFGRGTWTAISLETDSSACLLLAAGDLTGVSGLGQLSAVATLALRAVRERALRQQAEKLLRATYAINRRVSRPHSLESVCRELLRSVAESLDAIRISIGIHHPSDDIIEMLAARGDGTESLVGTTVEPGAWVMGHVHSSGRPVLVTNTLELPLKQRNAWKYRTTSFASVPLIAGGQTIGVLNATDKRDGSAFGSSDLRVLKTFGAAAALGIKSVIADSELGRLSRIAAGDMLTGLFNRQYFDTRMHQEIERAKRNGSSLTLLMVDIDDFKTINDTYGHQIGDAVLKVVGRTLQSAVRVFDICARYGGDEFAVLIPTSDPSSVTALAERIRQRVADGESTEPSDRLPPMTLSVGIALFEASELPEQLVRRADEALYEAKSAGKNRVHFRSERSNFLRLPATGSGQGTST